jgi:endonuclease/exonuclease/phosphatase family metal-dependent hydrolase
MIRVNKPRRRNEMTNPNLHPYLPPLEKAPGDESATHNGSREPNQLTIMTWNIDCGTGFTQVAAELHLELPGFLAGVAQIFAEIKASNPPERAVGVAGEIAAAQPDLVALQEVSQWWTIPMDPKNPMVPPSGPSTVVYDVLPSLLAGLKTQGLHYAPVALGQEWSITAPCAGRFWLGYTDSEVILARTDLPPADFTVDNKQEEGFTKLHQMPILGQLVSRTRGWASVDVHLPGTTFRFITTHLEAVDPDVQVAQSEELLLLPGPTPTDLPRIYAGDFNSPADGGALQTPTYNKLIAAGLVDLWRVANPADPGFTWPLHDEDPHTKTTKPTDRIDFVFASGKASIVNARLIGTSNLTPSGLWPSDHAGVVATVRIG